MRRHTFLLLSLFWIVSSLYAQEGGWCVSVWYPSSDHPGGAETLLANVPTISEVNPFWYSPLPDGQLLAHEGSEDAAMLSAWREAGLLIVPSIFSSIFNMLETEELRAIHVAAIVDTVERMDYDGIDLDYEGFPLSTREPFSLFSEALAEALHANGRLLSITVHAKVDDINAWESARAQDWERLAPVSDIFRIMTYDYTNRNEPPGPIAPTVWVKDVLAYAESLTDLERVRMGLHFYGYTWQRGNPPAMTVAWASISNYIDRFELEFTRNSDDMEAMLDFKLTGLPRQVVVIADPIGLDFKLRQIAEEFPSLGGVAIWGIGGEHPDLWGVLDPYTEDCRT